MTTPLLQRVARAICRLHAEVDHPAEWVDYLVERNWRDYIPEAPGIDCNSARVDPATAGCAGSGQRRSQHVQTVR